MRTPEQIRRQLETRRSRTPKTATAVMSQLAATQFNASRTEEPMLTKYVKSQNLKNRTKLVGKTVFDFGSDGICKLDVAPGNGRILYDLDTLLKMNGFSLVGESNSAEEETAEATEVAVAAAVEAAVAIDEEVVAALVDVVEEQIAEKFAPLEELSNEIESAVAEKSSKKPRRKAKKKGDD